MEINEEDLFCRRLNELSKEKNAGDYYKVIQKGAILRQLLLDQTPLLHTVNREHKVKILFAITTAFPIQIGPNTTVFLNNPFTQDSKIRVLKGHLTDSLPLKEFLKVEVLKIDNGKYTVQQLIKYTANKIGGVHLDKNLDNESKTLESALKRNRDHPILAVAMNVIVNITIRGLEQLRALLISLPGSTSLFAHYEVEKGSIYFAGKNWMQTPNLNKSPIKSGFGWIGRIKIIEQRISGKRFLYYLGSRSNSNFHFSIYVNKNLDLFFEVQFTNGLKSICIIRPFKEYDIFGKFFNLGCVLKIDQNRANLIVFFHKKKMTENLVELPNQNFEADFQIIGGDANGRRNASFYVQELLLLSKHDHSLDQALQYMERKWRF